jgi:hypothetical protein
MKSYIKGKKMRDVCAGVLDCSIDPVRPQYYKILVQWINLLGTVEYPKPFQISKAIETLYIRTDEFNERFDEYTTLEEVPGAKFGTAKTSA